VATICERDSRVSEVKPTVCTASPACCRAREFELLTISRDYAIFGRSEVVLVCGDIQLWSTLVKSHAQDVGDDQAAIEGDDAVQDLAGQVAEQRQR
jgi:hypothetical protein